MIYEEFLELMTGGGGEYGIADGVIFGIAENIAMLLAIIPN